MHEEGLRSIAVATAITLLLVFAPGSLPGPARAAAEEEEAPGARLAELVETTEQGIQEATALEEEVQAASGEQRDILVEQRRAAWESTGQALGELIQEILRLREQGIDDAGSRESAGRFLDELAVWNEHQVEAMSTELERLRAARDAAADEDRPALQQTLTEDNAEYDLLLVGWMSQCRAREALGLDASDQFAKVDELLTARAEERATQIRVARRRIADYTEKTSGADEEEVARLRSEITRLEERLDERVESLRQLADLMESRDLPTAEHRQLLIEATGEITSDIFTRDVAVGLGQRWWADARSWLAVRAPALAFKGVVAVILLFAFHLAGRLMQRIARSALESAKNPVSRLFQDFALATTYRIVMGLGILIVLSQLGVQVGPLLAGLGVASFIIGFALQDTLSNFASGMLILAYRPFDVGDVVNAGGVAGKVEQMTLVTTTILTFDNQRLIVPNTKIWGDVITNVTAERVRRVDLKFGIGYSDDIDRAEQILRDIVTNHDKVLDEPAPVVKLYELGDSSVNFIVRPWAKTEDYWDVSWDVTREVKRRFDADGVSIPFPQRDVHVFQGSGPKRDELL